ncbi:MAG: hypothetical protein R3190_06450, partial [Thermoanaerobaculia bacterium]|nr:hypothetical protein [Thermoanaerobaculia bacterium]
MEMQAGRTTAAGEVVAADGRRGRATLTDLQPNVGGWLVLEVDWSGGAAAGYHLSVAEGARGGARFDPGRASGLVLGDGTFCELWGPANRLETARRGGRAFEPVCDDRLFLRN